MKRISATVGLLIAIVGLPGAILFWQSLSAQAQQVAQAPVLPANVARGPAPTQPIPFSHSVHIALELGCESCHTNPIASRERGLPETATCMACHSTIAAEAPAIRTLAGHAAANTPVPWQRVYELLPGVTWGHGPHLEAGIDCASCHGNVAELEIMRVTTSVTAMASCISCHQEQNASSDCTVCHAWPTD